jgi:2'-5' RNA ligase
MPAALRSRLAEAVASWRAEADAPDLRWTAPDGWHLTLAFLGPTDPGLVPALLEAVRTAVAGRSRWAAPTGSIGTFPGPRRARVVWYGVADGEGRLGELSAAVRGSLEPMVPDLDTGSPFRAHITLGRARAPRGTDVTAWIEGRQAPRGSIPIDRVVLYRSHLGSRRPATYEALGSVMLTPAADAMMDAESEASVDD